MNQEEQNAIYEESSKDSSLTALICIGVMAIIGSVGALFYLRKRRNGEQEDNNDDTDPTEDCQQMKKQEREIYRAYQEAMAGDDNVLKCVYHKYYLGEITEEQLDFFLKMHEDKLLTVHAALDDEKAETDLPDDKRLEMELSRSSSHDSSSYQMNSYQNNIANDPVRNPPNEMSETDSAVHIDADASPRDEAIKAPSLNETNQGCKSDCFGWNFETFQHCLKKSNAPAVAEPRSAEPELHMAAMEEDSVSTTTTPQSCEDTGSSYFTETLRNVEAARADQSSLQRIVLSIFDEVSADDDSTNILTNENIGFLPAGQLLGSPVRTGAPQALETEGVMSTNVEEEPQNSAAHNDAEDDASEFDDVSINDESASSEDAAEKQMAKNNEKYNPLPRLPIDGALRKKFSQHGLQAISSRGKKLDQNK